MGAIGEFGPIVAVAVLLTNRDARRHLPPPRPLRGRRRGRCRSLATQVRPPRFIAADAPASALDVTASRPDLASCSSIFLVYLAVKLSLDVLLGAFAAGVVVRLFIKGEDSAPITSKLEAIGFGFLIPIFFIESGINFDLARASSISRTSCSSCPMFTLLFLVTRALPTWAFFRSVVTDSRRARWPIFAATGLPIIVVITTLGVRRAPDEAAERRGAGRRRACCRCSSIR